MNGKCLNEIFEGCRVWAEWGLHEHGRSKVSVPAKTGGTLVKKWKEFSSMENYLYTIKWDTGQTSIHYSNTVPRCILNFATETEFEQFVLDNADRAEIFASSKGTHYGLKVFLRNGNWATAMDKIKAELEAANIPIVVLKGSF